MLGVDLGRRRTGLALSDPYGLTCSPLEVVEERDEERLLLRIMEVAREQEVGEIVVGLPRPLAGGTNRQVESVLAFVAILEERAGIHVVTWDERFTSKLAEEGKVADCLARRRCGLLHVAGLSGLSREHPRRHVNDTKGQQIPAGSSERSPHDPIDPWYTEPARKRGSLGPSGRRPRRWLSRILIVGVFFGCLALIGAVVDRGVHWVEGRSSTSTTEAARGATVEVVISPGTTATQVGTLLEEQGVIESSAAFVDLVKSRGSESKLRPGIYQFSLGQELLKVVDMLEQGQGSVSFKLTIPEGMAASQVAALLTEEGTVPGESYLQLSGQPAKFVVPKVGRRGPQGDHT